MALLCFSLEPSFMWRGVRRCAQILIQSASVHRSSHPGGFLGVNHPFVTQARASEPLSPSFPCWARSPRILMQHHSFSWFHVPQYTEPQMLWELGALCRVQCSMNEYLEELFCHHSDLGVSLASATCQFGWISVLSSAKGEWCLS